MGNNLKNYEVLNPEFWTGRTDDPNDPDSFRIHQVIQLLNLNHPDQLKFTSGKLNICLLGFCCDEGVKRNLGRQGASKGPESIRKELANLPVKFGNKAQIFDAGNIFCRNGDLEEAQNNLAAVVKIILDYKLYPIILGGGHEVVYGHYKGITNHFNHKSKKSADIGIVNFDAHFDLRPFREIGTSGTMFSQISQDCASNNRTFKYLCLGIQSYANTISLFKKADKLGVTYILSKDLNNKNEKRNFSRINKFIKDVKKLYITICSDVFNSSHAPGVSSIQPFGLDPEVVLSYIKKVLESKKVVSIDIAEVSPRFDFDNRTAKLASVIIYAIINSLIELDYKENINRLT